MGKRTELSVEQRTEVVLALLRREEPAGKLARRYGISEPTLYRYRDQFLEGGKASLASGKRGKADPRDRQIELLEKDLAKRDQVIGELTIANRIFKKKSEGLL
jgi:transposase